MKKLFLLVLSLVGIINISLSQDTLHFLNKTLQAVKVHEIGIEEIKYHRMDNLDGPLYVANKNDIHYIKYANGHVDSVNVENKVKPAVLTQPFVVYNQTVPISTNEKIFINGSKLSYNGRAVGESRLLRLIINEPKQEKKSMLLKEYTKMKSFKKKQYLFGFVGLGAAIVCAYGGIITAVEFSDDAPLFAGLAAGAVIGITGVITSSIFKHKRTKQKVKVAELYNQ